MTFRIPASSRARLRDRLVVASVSGGKDSTALALLLREAEIPHVRVFADTGFEHPTTYEYLDLLRERLGEITTVRNELLWQDALPGEPGMLTLIRRKQMFPSRLRRFCTESLKLRPIKKFLEQVEEERGPLVNAVGVRADESASRARMPEWEWWGELDAEIWRPLLAATYDDIVEIHRRHNMPPNPLYLEGARRVGCHPCIFSAKHDIRQIAPISSSRSGASNRTSPRTPSLADANGRPAPSSRYAAPVDSPSPRSTKSSEQAHTIRGRPWDPAADPPGAVAGASRARSRRSPDRSRRPDRLHRP
ncbi:MAG: phosphoadenosine phosphosulfate reductase family protein [Nannocystis sp.]|nr:phosphoadenosine phosphosulfate reductase family protein [Nannocystis sp.]